MIKKILCGVCACVMLVAVGLGLVGCGGDVRARDFSIEISVVTPEFAQSQNIEVQVVFRNLTGRRLTVHSDMGTDVFVFPVIPNTSVYYSGNIRQLGRSELIIESYDVYRTGVIKGERLPQGEHILTYQSNFWINYRNSRSRREILAVSNGIVLTVL